MATAPTQSVAGGTLSYAQLKAVWLQAAAGSKYATNAWASLMAAIAEAESGGNPAAQNPNDNGGRQTSWGLWQISLGNHAVPSPSWTNPEENARLAIGKLNSQGLTAWGTYTSGAYKAFMSSKTSPDTSALGPGITSGGATDPQTAAYTAAVTGLAADCLWPPSAKITVPVIPGVYSQSFQVPCLLSRGEARALAATGLLIGGLLIAGWGLSLMAVAAGLPIVAQVIGKVPGARTASATGDGSKTDAAVTQADVAPAA